MFEQFEIENGLIIGNRNSMEMKVEGMVSNIFTSEGRNNMRLIEVILDDKNLNEAVKRVKRNKGVAGVDKMIVYEIDTYFQNNKERIKKEILEKKYNKRWQESSRVRYGSAVRRWARYFLNVDSKQKE